MRPLALLFLSGCLPAATITTSAMCRDVFGSQSNPAGCSLSESDNSGSIAFSAVNGWSVSATALGHGSAPAPVAYDPFWGGFDGGPFSTTYLGASGQSSAVYDADLEFTITGGSGNAIADPMLTETVNGDSTTATGIQDLATFGNISFAHNDFTPGIFTSSDYPNGIAFVFGIPFTVHVHLESDVYGGSGSHCNCGGGTGTTSFDGFQIYTPDGHSYALALGFAVLDKTPPQRTSVMLEAPARPIGIPPGEMVPEPGTLGLASASALMLAAWRRRKRIAESAGAAAGKT